MKIVRNDRLIIVTNRDFKVVLSMLGAGIVSISMNDELLTMTPVNLDDLNRKDIYYGKTIGPIANRVKDGLIVIDNKEYRLPLNEEGVSNHSGSLGLSNKLFVAKILDNRVVFTYQQKIDDVNISYGIAYTFNDDYQIRIDYVVRASKKVIISLTNHTFFTLGESSIDGLSIKIPSDRFIESDKDSLLPLEDKAIIDCLNFNDEKSLIKDIDDPYLMNHKAKGYDYSFILKNEKEVSLKSPKHELNIKTDYPCIHIYTDNYEDNVKTIGSSNTKRRSVAIEPVDNMLDRPLIDKDEIYQRYIIYSFKAL